MTFAIGETIGPYRIIAQLGQGGMATVFKAYHPSLDRYVAIKALHPAFKQDPAFLARFEREARIVAKLDHPNIIPIHDFSKHDGTPYLVIRYIDGRTLKTVLKEGLLPLDRVFAILAPVSDALAYAHSQGILHRDIKPSNIMLAKDGHIYLSDFGLARMVQVGETTMSQDMLIGTPQYMSPEQAKGAPLDAKSDVYSLGVVAFEMLTGRVPFNADTPYAVIHDHIYAPLPLPTSINPNLSPDLERVLLKALAKSPADRYSSPVELVTALQQASTPAPSVAPITTLSNSENEAAPAPRVEISSPRPCPAPAPPAAEATLAPATPLPVEEPTSATAPAPSALPAVSPSPVASPSGPPAAPHPVVPATSSQIKTRGSKLPSGSCAIAGVVALAILFLGVALVWAQHDTLGRYLRALRPVPTQQADPLRDAKDRVAANPQDPEAHIQLGDVLARRKDIDAAYASYDKAIQLDPKSTSGYLHAGALAESLNDLVRAITYYKNGLAALPDNEDLLLAMTDVLFKQKRWDDGRAAIDQILAKNPKSAQALWRSGEYYRAQGKTVEALREYSRALALDPALPEAHFGLGMLALQRGANDEAKRQFQLVVNNPVSPPDLKDQANKQLRTLGQ